MTPVLVMTWLAPSPSMSVFRAPCIGGIGVDSPLYITGHPGISFPLGSPSPSTFSSDMPPSEVDPSTLTPHKLSKMNKKDVIKYLGTLQEMFTERGKKYGMSRNGPLTNIPTHSPTREGKNHHSQKHNDNSDSSQKYQRGVDPKTTWSPLP